MSSCWPRIKWFFTIYLFILKYKFIYFNWRLLTLQYCIGFVIDQHESSTGIHMFSIPNPPPSSLPVPSLSVVPVHQPQATSIMHPTWTGDSFHIWYYTCFSAILPIIPPSPSPTESKRLFYTSVSLLLSPFKRHIRSLGLLLCLWAMVVTHLSSHLESDSSFAFCWIIPNTVYKFTKHIMVLGIVVKTLKVL